MKKNIVVVTGGAGFVGSNLIEFFKKTKYKILSIDNYSSGTIKNHIKNKRVSYIKGETKNIGKILNSKKKEHKFHISFW